MFGTIKYPFKNQLTLLLLVAFVLVKANPGYYALQFTGLSDLIHSTHINNSQLSARHAYSLLVKADKSITESIDTRHVPEIKFTGTPFMLFLLGFGLTVLLVWPVSKNFNYTILKNEACIGKCILRL